MPRRRFLSAVGAVGFAGAAGIATTSTACASTTAAAPHHAEPAMHHAAGLMTLIGSYTSANPPGRGLEVAIRDEAGVLEPSGVVDGVPDASFFAWSPDHEFLYATNEIPQGTITAVDLSGHHPVALNS